VTKAETDIGLDYVCQVLAPVEQSASWEGTGATLGAQVKTVQADAKRGSPSELMTPALVLDLDAFEQNISAYQQLINAHGRIELLRDRDKADSLAVKCLDDLREVGKGASDAVDLVDNDRIDPACGDVAQQLLQARALHVAP
jgi:hypothetical protein